MRDIPKSIFITGTDTGVGKTVVSAALSFLLKKKGKKVGVIKPFQTGTDLDVLTDVEFIFKVLNEDY
ncbi:MAG: AAA family ATPase, partial [Candidatus Dadabacteria bacterium]|nr:AAA family ATPase [Candidatus Dadabacteria bacterium]NIQ13885.1 AAA family ATPase [Candidatus Dadabacteria bacterium]